MAWWRAGWAAGTASLLALALTGLAGAEPETRLPARETPPVPVQRLRETPRGRQESLPSEHFLVRFDPAVLSREQAEQAREQAERAWIYCRERFGEEPKGKVTLDLTPQFVGATGFARPGDPNASDPARRPLIGIRYADLDYLGLTAEYVITHEVAHIFSGDLAGSALGEGIADWAAGSFSTVPVRLWWGRELRQAGLWIDPEAFFITGDFDASPEVTEVIRTAQYVESGLLVRYLVDRYGWPKVRAFAADYGKARGRLESNEDRRRQPPARGSRMRERPEPTRIPDPEAVRGAFHRHFTESWTRLLSDWEKLMAEDAATPAEARRLVLAQKIYGSIRNYEMWTVTQRVPVAPQLAQVVREAFREANRLLAAGEQDRAEEALNRARAMVERLRKPAVVAYLTGNPNNGNFEIALQV